MKLAIRRVAIVNGAYEAESHHNGVTLQNRPVVSVDEHYLKER